MARLATAGYRRVVRADAHHVSRRWIVTSAGTERRHISRLSLRVASADRQCSVDAAPDRRLRRGSGLAVPRASRGFEPTTQERAASLAIIRHLEKVGDTEGSGVWVSRDTRRQCNYSKVMVRLGIDRMLRMPEQDGTGSKDVDGSEIERLKVLRQTEGAADAQIERLLAWRSDAVGARPSVAAAGGRKVRLDVAVREWLAPVDNSTSDLDRLLMGRRGKPRRPPSTPRSR